MKIVYPDYENCIANLANSILNHFGVQEEGREGLSLIEPYLQKKYKNVVVLLLDGLGKSIMERNLSQDGFFNSHFIGDYSSIFPPTTVAATTSIANGLQPCQHRWLGWDCYFPQIDKNVTVFMNNETETDKPAADYNVVWKYCNYESVVKKINKCGKKAYEVTPFIKPYPEKFDTVCERIEELCAQPEEKYIYSYWPEPDSLMHRNGCESGKVKELVEKLEQQVRNLCDHLSDTLVIVTADHGHMNSDAVSILDYPRIMDCLVRLPSIEPRALNLFVKEGKKEQLEKEFAKEFGNKFMLLTRKQVLEMNLFGTNPNHPDLEGMLGDYLAVAVDKLSIYSTKNEKEMFLGVHAGMTEEEMRIPLIVVEKERENF